MRQHLRLIILFLSSVLLNAALSQAAPDFVRIYKEGEIQTDWLVERMRTTQNYDELGKKQPIPLSDGYFQTSNTLVRARMSMTSHWAWNTQLHFNSAETYDGVLVRNNTSLSKIEGGVDSRLHYGAWDWIGFSDLYLSPGKVDETGAIVLNDEYDNGIRIGGIGQYLFRRQLLSGLSLAYQYRDGGRSGLLPWRFFTDYHFNSGLIEFELRGQFTANRDRYTDDVFSRNSVTGIANSGSYKYYSVNPEFTEVEITTRFDVTSQFGLILGAGQVLQGKNAANGSTLLAGLSISWQAIEPTARPKQKIIPPTEFHDESENNVNQTWFHDDHGTQELTEPQK